MSSITATRPAPGVTSRADDHPAVFATLDEEIAALRDSAASMNRTYAHSGLTNPRADRLLTRAEGMQYVLDRLRAA